MRLLLVILLAVSLAAACAFRQPKADYTPANAAGNQCMNECLILAFTGNGCGKGCDEVLDACYARCEAFHGGKYVPLSLQKEQMYENGSGAIRKDRFED